MVHFLIMPLSQGSTEHPSSGAFSAVLQDVDNRQEGGPAQSSPVVRWLGVWGAVPGPASPSVLTGKAVIPLLGVVVVKAK